MRRSVCCVLFVVCSLLVLNFWLFFVSGCSAFVGCQGPGSCCVFFRVLYRQILSPMICSIFLETSSPAWPDLCGTRVIDGFPQCSNLRFIGIYSSF